MSLVMNEQTRKAAAVALRALADALEATETMPATEQRPSARYYTRKSWIDSSGGGGKEFDRALRELQSFKVGRGRLIRNRPVESSVVEEPRERAPLVTRVTDRVS